MGWACSCLAARQLLPYYLVTACPLGPVQPTSINRMYDPGFYTDNLHIRFRHLISNRLDYRLPLCTCSRHPTLTRAPQSLPPLRPPTPRPHHRPISQPQQPRRPAGEAAGLPPGRRGRQRCIGPPPAPHPLRGPPLPPPPQQRRQLLIGLPPRRLWTPLRWRNRRRHYRCHRCRLRGIHRQRRRQQYDGGGAAVQRDGRQRDGQWGVLLRGACLQLGLPSPTHTFQARGVSRGLVMSMM